MQAQDSKAIRKALLDLEEFQAARAWWEQQLPETLPSHDLAFGLRDAHAAKLQLKRSLGADASAWVSQVAKGKPLASFVVLLQGVFWALRRFSSQERVMVGTAPLASAELPYPHDAVALLHQLDPALSFTGNLNALGKCLRDSYAQQHYPLELLLSARGLGSVPHCFDVWVEMEGLHKRVVWQDFQGVRLLIRTGGDFAFEVECPDHFPQMREVMEAWLDLICHTLQRAASGDTAPLQDYHRPCTFLRPEAGFYPQTGTILDLLSAQVAARPEVPALVCKEKTLSYADLHSQALRLAHVIRTQDDSPRPVTLYLTRGERAFIAIWACWLAAKPYVPVDTESPLERLRFVVQDSGAGLLLHDISLDEKNSADLPALHWDKAFSMPIDAGKPLPKATPADLAYMIYTSGSTGQPKAVMVSHHNLHSLMQSLQAVFAFTPADVVLSGASYAFDLSLHDMFAVLCGGGHARVVFKEEMLDMAALMQHFREATYVVMVAGVLAEALRYIQQQGLAAEMQQLRYFCTGAEAVSSATLEGLQAVFPRAEVAEGYGPTEATVMCTNGVFAPGERINGRLIGRSMPHARVYVQAQDGAVAGLCEPGEILIGGSAVTLGYLNRPELTAEKFVPAPDGVGRVYRSGDLGRMMPDGRIEFLGRIDQQLKIRGYRVEPGEVERHLAGLEGVAAAIVTAIGEGNAKHLAAYFIPAHADVQADALLSALAAALPPYMVPSFIVPMQAFPMTLSGKIDRKALPDPRSMALSGSFKAPRDEKEQMLAEVFQSVLGIARIGIDDKFFALGGDSIKSIQAASRLRKRGFRLELQDLFRHPSISTLAPFVQPLAPETIQEPVQGDVPLTAIQRHFFELYGPASHFNQAMMLHSPARLHMPSLEAALQALMVSHDALRMVFLLENGGPRQYNRSVEETPLLHVESVEVVGDPALEIPPQANRIQASIDLQNGPLIKAACLHAPDGDHLLIVVHHLIVDIVSWRILLEDLQACYSLLQASEPIPAPDRGSSFQAWAQALDAYADSEALRSEIPYWDSQLVRTVHDFTGDAGQQADLRSHHVQLSAPQTEQLRKHTAAAWGMELNEILLLALGRALYTWTGSNAFLLDIEGHGREPLGTGLDLNQTLGWFTAIFPFVLDASSPDLKASAQTLRAAYRAVPNKGMGYGILAWMGQNPQHTRWRAGAQARISYNYLGVQDAGSDGDAAEGWGFSTYHSGNNVDQQLPRQHFLEIDGLVSEGILLLRMHYNAQALAQAEIERLGNAWEAALLEIAAHPPQRPLIGPSDHGMPQMPLQDWEYLQAQIPADQGIQEIYPLSPMQEGMLFHALKGTGDAYFEQMTYTLRGDFDPALVEQTYAALLQRYDILRTGFYWNRLQRPVQVVFQQPQLEFSLHDFRAGDADRLLAEYQQADRVRGFAFGQPCMSRMAFCRLGADRWAIVWSNHHILFDGWCMAILLGEFFEIHAALQVKKSPALAPALPYRHYIDWLQAQSPQAARHYWANLLDGYKQRAGLPTKSLQAAQSYAPARHVLELSEGETAALEQFARAEGLSLGQVLQTLWGLFLQHRNNCEDVVFGMVVSGRPPQLEGVETMVGLFVNTIPVRVDARGCADLRGLLARVKAQAGESAQHDYLPLAEIQAQNPLGAHLIDHLFVFDNYPVADALADSGAGQSSFEVEDVQMFEQTNYNFDLTFHPGKALRLQFNYNENAITAATITDAALRLRSLIHLATTQPDVRLDAISLATPSEIQQLRRQFNPPASPLPPYASLQAVFAENARLFPERIAAVCGERRLSYATLSALSAQRAHWLQAQAVGAGDVVALCLHADEHLLAWMLACLRLRAAFTLLEPALPLARRQWIAQDSAAKIVLLDQEESGWERAWVQNAALKQQIATYPETFQDAAAQGSDAVLIQYTSGSTGHPKGVGLSQANLLNLFGWYAGHLNFTPEDVFLQKTTIGFGDCWAELLLPITFGRGACHLRHDDDLSKDLPRLAQWAAESRATILQFVPAVWDTFTLVTPPEALAHMRVLVLSGGRVKQHYDYPFEVHNIYGNSECAALSTAFVLSKADPRILIGKPVANTQIWLLGPRRQLLPPGYTGEMYIAGKGVGVGYLGLPEQNAACFLPDPEGSGTRYRTGDLAAWTADGQLDYRGRVDEQLKIRGQRVEAGEIEFQLMALAGVRRAVVMAQSIEGGEPRLLAWVEGPQVPSEAEMQAALGEFLPGHMIPARIIALPAFPLNANGKIDKQALPMPDLRSAGQAAPQDDLEADLLAEWKAVLGGDFGVEDEFAALGGHSLLAVRLVAAIHRRFGLLLPFNVVANTPTVRKQALLIRELQSIGATELGQEMTVANPAAAQKLFLFPPGIGFGLIFQALAEDLPDIALHLFDFIEREDPLPRYLALIRQAQPKGPYWLGGYSAGGHIALRVAKMLEAEGEEVLGLIFLDSLHHAAAHPLDAAELAEYVARYVHEDASDLSRQMLMSEALREGLRQRVAAYYVWECSHPDVDVVRAPIHQIHSQPMPEAEWLRVKAWEAHTQGGFHLIAGSGSHYEMLEEEHRIANAAIIRAILQTK